LHSALPTRSLTAHDTVPDWDALIEGAFIVCVTDDPAPLHRINRIACSRAIPWLPIRFTNTAIRFGPTVLPSQGACFRCLELRERAAAAVALIPEVGNETDGGISPSHPPVLETGPGADAVPTLIALEILQTLIGEPSRARGRLGLFTDTTGEWTWHPVLRDPRCPDCGALPWRSLNAGTAPLERFVDRETGIVPALLPVGLPEREPEPPHVFVAFHANTHAHDDWEALPLDKRIATGKGWTVEAARHSALGEALERYCATSPVPLETFRIASHAALDVAAIGAEAFGLYSARQYADGSVPYVPVTRETPLHWVAGHSLTHDCPVFVPASLVFMLPLDFVCQQTSSGLAAASTYVAAALHALCEVIERDAFLLTWLTMRPVPLLDIHAVGVPVSRVVRHYAAGGVTLTAHDLTTTTGVPAVLVRAHDEYGTPPLDLFSLGCDADPLRAVERAVLEIVQERRARWDVIAERGAPAAIRSHTDHALWYALADRGDALAFLGAASGPLPPHVGVTDDPAATLAAIVAALDRAGHEVVIVDITTPDVRTAGMVVVRAVVTGLLPLHFGVGQERLGSARLAEYPIDSLNRAPHPLA
jgi:ribosomal protein S12 methylthiotransferase accessory factor